MEPEDEFTESKLTVMRYHFPEERLLAVVPFTYTVAFVNPVTVIVFEDEIEIELPADISSIVLLFASYRILQENDRNELIFGNVQDCVLPL